MTDADMKVLFAFLIGVLIFAVLNRMDQHLKRSADLMEVASETMTSASKDIDNIRNELEDIRRMVRDTRND